MADKDNQPPKPDPKNASRDDIDRLLNKDGQIMRSPLLWFVLLVIPLVATFYAAFTQGGEKTAAPKPAIVYTPQEGQSAAKPQQLMNDRRGETGAATCDYDEWVGKQADQQMQEALKAKNVSFRILPPGAMMTMDYSARRVNFDVDADGKITRAWCG